MEQSQVVAPDLFDAIAEPGVLLPLVMANAMSPRLWRLGRRVATAPDPLEAARRVVDTSFTHASPEAMARVSGYLDLDAERRRLGARVVDDAIAEIDRAWEERRRRGLLPDGDGLQGVMASGRFPAYSYANVDVVHAARRTPGGPGQRPRGLTSCMDEAALFAALLIPAPNATARLDGVALLLSSTHSTAFCWAGDEAWWFWGKRALFTRADFAGRVEQRHHGDVAEALVEIMAAPMRRIVSRRGTLDLTTGRSSLPPDEVQRTLAAIDRFFGCRPDALAGPIDSLEYVPPSAHDRLFDQAVRCTSADEVQGLVRDALHGDADDRTAATHALLAFRSLDLDDLMPYLHAARRGPLVTRLAATLGSADQAIAAVAALGAAPALGDPRRLALPDEVLGRGSASAAERALLLHVLLERVGSGPVRTVLMGDDAITRSGSLAVRASDLAQVNAGVVDPAGPAFDKAAPAGQQ